jgi:hypothetical protein
MRPAFRRGLWFVALWALGVGALGAVAAAIKLFL